MSGTTQDILGLSSTTLCTMYVPGLSCPGMSGTTLDILRLSSTTLHQYRGGATGLRVRSIEFATECSFARKRCFDVHGL